MGVFGTGGLHRQYSNRTTNHDGRHKGNQGPSPSLIGGHFLTSSPTVQGCRRCVVSSLVGAAVSFASCFPNGRQIQIDHQPSRQQCTRSPPTNDIRLQLFGMLQRDRFASPGLVCIASQPRFCHYRCTLCELNIRIRAPTQRLQEKGAGAIVGDKARVM